jgi:phosphoketolase
MNQEIERIKKYVRATNYLVVSQIYLQSNFLLKEKLNFEEKSKELKSRVDL